MFDWDNLREIGSTIRHNKLRTFLTGFSVSWGIFMLIVLLAAGNGLRNGIMYNFRNMSMNKVQVWNGYTNKPWKGMQPGREISFKESDFETLRNHFPEIGLLSPSAWHSDTISTGKEYINGTMQGVYPDHAKINYVNVSTKNGRFINEIDLRNARKVIVLSPRMEEVLFPNEKALGKYIQAGGIMWQVVGVYNDDEKSNDAPAYIPFTTAKNLYFKGYGISSFSFTVNGLVTKEANERFESRLREVLGRIHNFDPTDHNAMGLWNTADNFRMTNNIMNGITLFIWVIGIGTLIAGIVGVSNIMLITVRERTKEFGIRKAIGAKPSAILKLVITESILVTAIFGYWGMLLGIGLTELINQGMMAAGIGEENGTTGVVFLNPTVSLGIAVSATLLIIFAGVIAGYFPARKAVKISAIEAMRTE